MNRKEHSYVWIKYCENKKLWENKDLNNSDIAKIIKLGININYDNEIRFNNHTTATKKNLNKMLNISKSSFESFFNLLLSKDFLYFEENNKYKIKNFIKSKIIKTETTIWSSLRLNKNYIYKGTLNKYIFKTPNEKVAKLYVYACNNFFESELNYHQLGYIFQLIPFLDKNNSINIEDALIISNYKESNKYRFLKMIEQIPYVEIYDDKIIISKKLLELKN